MTTIEARIVLNSAKLAVARFNHNSGHNYKQSIRQAWYDGNYRSLGLGDLEGQLQCIRNQFGPSWLIRAQPMEPDFYDEDQANWESIYAWLNTEMLPKWYRDRDISQHGPSYLITVDLQNGKTAHVGSIQRNNGRLTIGG